MPVNNHLPSGCLLTQLAIFSGEKGDVFHALKASDPGFAGFGEAYFSSVKKGAVKGWKKHRRMTLNLIVPLGAIRFVLYQAQAEGQIFEVVLSPENYQRLTVPPGIWMAFQGLADGENLLLNIASISHDPAEAESLPLENAVIPFNNWKV